ncbi:MAG: hypothetical protein L3K04_03505 [Thermoplasmata archaeon]|nr:hypothetical protein [Thermoplasmata archaeon]
MVPQAAELSQLRRLFLAAGYRLSDNDRGLLAWRFEDRRAVLLLAPDQPLVEAARELPADAAHRTLLCLTEPGEEVRGLAAQLGVELLLPEMLGPALGELLLRPIGTTAPEPTHPSTPLEAPVGVFPTSETVVRPRLSREDAERIAGPGGSRCTLRLLPFFVAAYRVRSPSPPRDGSPVREELVAVNGLTGEGFVWNLGQRELVAEIPPPFQKLEAVLNESQARAHADEFLRHRHTIGVDHTEQHEGALVIERRRVAPGPEDLRIGPFALLHVPYWYVEGPEGRVVVDAVTGTRGGDGGRSAESPA